MNVSRANITLYMLTPQRRMDGSLRKTTLALHVCIVYFLNIISAAHWHIDFKVFCSSIFETFFKRTLMGFPLLSWKWKLPFELHTELIEVFISV